MREILYFVSCKYERTLEKLHRSKSAKECYSTLNENCVIHWSLQEKCVDDAERVKLEDMRESLSATMQQLDTMQTCALV